MSDNILEVMVLYEAVASDNVIKQNFASLLKNFSKNVEERLSIDNKYLLLGD